MGAEISKTVHSQLEHSTLESLLANDKYIEEFEKAIPVLNEDARDNLKRLFNLCQPPSSRPKKQRKGQNGHASSSQDAAPAGERAVLTGDNIVSLGLSTNPVASGGDATKSGDATSSSEDATAEGALSVEDAASSGEDSRLRPLWNLKEEDVALSSEIAGSLEKWKADPSSFLRGDCSQIPSSPVEHYDYARRVQTSLASNKILWRFVTTTYYDIISVRSQSERYSITKEMVAFMVAVVCGSSPYEREAVEKDVINWAKYGKRNRGLANKLGSTACYFFYPDISDWIWIKHLPQDSYDRAANLLRKLGILEKAQRYGVVDLANQIERILKAPFQSVVPTQPQVGQWIFPIISTSDERATFNNEEGNEVTQSQPFEDLGAQQGGHRFNLPPENILTTEAIDLDCSSSSSALTLYESALPRLAANGLIKMKWPPAVHVPCFGGLEHMLFDFYVNSICVGRTVLKDNAYINEFLPILQSNGCTINPVLALSASYRKEYFLEGSFERKQIEYAEFRYSMETAKEVREGIVRGDVGASAAVAAALLSHHATLNPSMHQVCWTKYLYPMIDSAGINLEANLAMASVAILAMTALPLNGERSFQHFDYHWIGFGEAEQLTQVNSNLGLSRMMLYFIYSITQEAKYPDERSAERLLQEIEKSPQWVDESEDDMPRYIALQTAETYRFGTRLYCLARLYGYTPEHPAIKQTCDSLLRWLYDLPTEGPWYSSIHPAWCFVIACICVQGEEDYNVLVNYLDRIAGDNKSNVDDCCSLVRRIRNWQRQEWENQGMQGQDTGWWERMAGNVEGEFVVCLA